MVAPSYTARPNRVIETDTHLLIAAVRANDIFRTHTLLSAGANPNIPHEITGRTTLHEAALHRNLAMINLLIAFRMTHVNARDADGLSAIDKLGVEYDSDDEEPLLIVLELLLDRGVNPSLDINFCTTNQALFWAARKGFRGVVLLLLNHGADPRVALDSDTPFVSNAAHAGGHEDIELLLAFIERTPENFSLVEALTLSGHRREIVAQRANIRHATSAPRLRFPFGEAESKEPDDSEYNFNVS
jgi:ankyrin repeat protein